VTAIVDAYEHGVVFTQTDIEQLIKTGLAEKRLWTALAPFNKTIQANFESTHQPASWGGLGGTPQYLYLQEKLAGASGK
jgi:hypothetical protein